MAEPAPGAATAATVSGGAEPPETVESVAAEAQALLEAALNHGSIQRDSVRMVLACHAAMARLLPAHAREVGDLVRSAREPMTPAERDAWKAEFLAEVTAALARLEGTHCQGVQDYALALRDEAARLVRAADHAAVWRAAWAMVAMLLLGAALGAWGTWLLLRGAG